MSDMVTEVPVDQSWVSVTMWCPYGQGLPNPMRALVEVGYLDDDEVFRPVRAHLMLDLTDARQPRLDIAIEDLPAERKDAFRHWGGGFTRPLEGMSAELGKKYGL